MLYEGRMEQHYAVSESGVLSHIKDAHESGEEYFCPYCGCRMIKRCGNIRTWHFAHDYRYQNEVDIECSYESYLHAFAKLRLKQWFDESSSIMLCYKQQVVCKHLKDCKWIDDNNKCSRLIEKSVDLKKYLTNCQIEETVRVNGDMFRADLYLSNHRNSKNNILVEIKVTHECTQKKKESNARIIEFEVHSEEDVEKIITSDIRESETVNFYGFNPQIEVDDDFPAKPLTKFVYFDSGKAYSNSECNCRSYMNRGKNVLMEITVDAEKLYDIPIFFEDRITSFSHSLLFYWGLALAKKYGYNVRHCGFCKYCTYGSCAFKSNKENKKKDAFHCEHYCENEDAYQKNIKELHKFMENNIVDIWQRHE